MAEDAPKSTRVRKQTARLDYEEQALAGGADKAIVAEGDGEELGSIPTVAATLSKVNADHDLLQALHSLLYNRAGSQAQRKKNLRKFNGWPSEEVKKAKAEKLAANKKWNTVALKDLTKLLGLPQSGDRTTLVERVVDFLAHPTSDASKAQGGASTKRKSEASGGGKVKKAKKDKADRVPRPLSGYMYFVNQKRAQVVKDNPGMSFGETGSKLGALWKGLSEAEQQKYKKKAADEFEKSGGAAKAAAMKADKSKKPAAKTTKKAKASKAASEEEEEEEEEEAEQADEDDADKDDGEDDEQADDKEEEGDEDGDEEE